MTIDWITPEHNRQEMGVPQGSILRVTLFASNCNQLATTTPKYIHNSLFVDDVQIAFSDGNIINQKLQL